MSSSSSKLKIIFSSTSSSSSSHSSSIIKNSNRQTPNINKHFPLPLQQQQQQNKQRHQQNSSPLQNPPIFPPKNLFPLSLPKFSRSFNFFAFFFFFLFSLLPFPPQFLLNVLAVSGRRHGSASSSSSSHHPFAQGNLFVVFHPRSGRSSEHSPQMANLSALWCQASSNGEDRLPIKEARFVKVLPRPESIHEASRYNGARDRAFLDFGSPASISSIGKYRCEITLANDDEEEGEGEEESRPPVTGNLFIYMRPVLLLNASMRLEHVEEGNFFSWIGAANRVSAGDDVQLYCPVAGYPLPEIRWFKDGEPINTSALLPSSSASRVANGKEKATTRKHYSSLDRRKYLLYAQSLYIREVDGKDESNYKCVARNSFPLAVDEPAREFQLSLEQYLRVASTMSWLLPLLVILVCLMLLALIIWACSQRERYKHNHYNVAQKEKERLRSKSSTANSAAADGGEAARQPLPTATTDGGEEDEE